MMSETDCINKKFVLIETKTLQQARERTYLQWPIERHPCCMKMKKAGWFVFLNSSNQFIAVCLYCQVAFKDWNDQHDPYKVHQTLSPRCIFILYNRNFSTSSSSIIEYIPKKRKIRPSSHPMAFLPDRVTSFRQYLGVTPHHSFETLAEFGLFFTDQNSMVECFSCHSRRSILNIPNDPMMMHTNQCKYAKHLRNHSQRSPLRIQGSNKIYQIDNKIKDNKTLYFLRYSDSSSIPAILLSVYMILSNDQQLEQIDIILKQLQSTIQFSQEINCLTSCDGPLVHILNDLANNSRNLKTLSDDQPCLLNESSIVTTSSTNNLSFRCKTCLKCDASPYLVPIGCSHLGLCSAECFFNWMTCVICGYTLGRVVRIYNP